MFRVLAFLGLLAGAAPATADVTGRYLGDDGTTIIVEVSETGMARVGGEGIQAYTLLDGADGFIVTIEDGVTNVVRLSDLREVVAEALGEPPGSMPELVSEASRWVAAGEATVEGRSGTEYRLPDEPLPEGQRIVLSDDARLAPLGLAWSRASFLVPWMLRGPDSNRDMDQLSEMLATRAPLQLGAITLLSASFDEIEPTRFALPAAPLSRAEVAALMESQRRRSDPDSRD